MNPEQIFSLCGGLAMLGWAGLVLIPKWHITRDWIAPVIIPLLIGICYAWLMATNFSSTPAGGGFDSLAAVATLFSIPELLLAGWIHYLAFDLFVGAWELKDGQSNKIPHLLLVPCMLLTFMAGPAGLLLYWIVKIVYLRLTQKPLAA